jgi:hypothetical protein
MTARTHHDYLEDIRKAAAKAIEFFGNLDLERRPIAKYRNSGKTSCLAERTIQPVAYSFD